jgi:hypothetical protein
LYGAASITDQWTNSSLPELWSADHLETHERHALPAFSLSGRTRFVIPMPGFNCLGGRDFAATEAFFNWPVTIVAHSWISNRVNEPIYSEQLHALFGTGILRALAAKLDLMPRDLVRHLSQALPRAMNKLSAQPDARPIP